MALKLTRTSTGKTWSSTSKKAEEEKKENKTTGATKAPVEENKQAWKSKNLTLTRSSSAPVVNKQEDDEPDFFERLGKILSGAGKATTSDYTNAAGTLYQGGQSGRTARNQELLEEYQYGLAREQKKMNDLLAANKRSPGTFSAKEIQSQQYLIDDWQRKVDSMTKALGENVQEKATTATYGIVDNLQEKSQQDIERAKQGLGAVGQFAVDAGVAGAQLAGDIGLAALSGGSTMAPMAARVFGGSAGEARRAGATYGQQVAYGASSALVSTLTERISNVAGPFKKAFGTGMLDDALAKVTAKPMGKILVSALSEGGEEILEAIMQPLLQKMTYNPDAAYDSEWFADMLYSGAIGAVLGGMGGVADPSTYRRSTEPVVEAQPAGLAPAEQEQTAEGTFNPEAVTAAEGEKTAPAHVGIQDAYRAGRANVPRDKVSFISEEQEEAYMRGRRDHIKYASDSELAIENQQAAEYTGINNQEDANYGTEVHLREGGERADGTYPGRPVSAVEESAGRNQSRKATVRPADGEAANLSYGKKVSTASLGIEGGSTSDGVFLVKGSTKATEAAQRYAAERGMDLVLFMGHDLHTNEAPEGARGLRDGNKLYVRADDPDFTAEQIARHEGGHDMIAKGEVDIAKVRERVAKAVGGGDMSKASALYAAAYSGTTLTADDIWEECICDSLAGMNIFAEVAPEVASFMEGVLSVTKQEAETSRQAPRGPPADAGTNKHSFRIGGNKDERRRDAQRAFEASETLRWDEDELNRERREAVERRGAFSQRMAASNATTKRVGHLLYGYLSIPTRKASDYGKECASEFKKIGVDNFFIYDGEVQVNYAGKTIGHSSDGVTLEDGSIGINNRASAEDGGMTPKNVAAHEAIHQRLDNKDAAALAYQSTLMQNIDRHSGTFKMYASAINFGYFKYKLNPKSESHALRFASEFAAYVGGHMYSGDVDPSGMIRDYEAVRKALEKALGVKIPAKKQYSHRVSDARIEEIRKAVEAGKPVSATDEVHYSRRFDREFMQAAINANARYKRVSDKNMTEAARVRQAVADIFNNPELAESLGLPPDILGNTYIPNGSYSGTEENTTECIRTLAADELMDAVAEVLGRPLTVEDTIAISQEYWKYTDKPECLYCYVAMDRKAHREFLGAYLKQRDDAIRNVKNGMSKEDAYQNFLDGRKDTKPMKKRFDMWMKNMGGEMISPADLASRASMEKAAGRSANIKAQVNDALKYAQSASWAKKRISYTAYNNHILKWKQSRIDNLNGNYGLRMYSFSDFSPAFILENMQMVTDAAVRGLKVLAYTKEMAFAKIFAKTGMNINISVFGYDDGNGGVAMDGMQGADWAEAQQLRSQYPNVGCTFVATNDSQVAWALDQDWIDVIIPFHMVRTGTKVANYFGWKNYTAMSADTKNKNWTKGDAKHILPPEHQNNKAMYLRACEENHLTPRFNDWVDHPNYMKLVNETRQSEGNTKPVQPIFDLDAAEASIEEMGKRGGYYQPIGGTRDLMQELAEEIAETVEKKLGGVKHSRRLTADDNAYIKALENGDAETAQKMVDDAAKAAGFNIKLHHGTAAEPFYVFRQGREGIHFGTFSQAIHRAEVSNKEYKFRGDEYSVEDIRKNPGKIPDSARKRIIFEMLNFMAVDLTQEERNKAAGSLYSDAPISNKDFLYYLGKAEKSGRKEWTLTNDVMGKTGKKRVISAWVKAQHPMTIGTDLGSWSPFKLASVLIDKINGKSSNLYNYQSGIDEQFDPSTIKGIKLTEADLPALRELQDSKNFEDVAKFLQSKGVDSIRYLNTYEGTGDEESYILLSPEQVKSADPATYDDNGDAIPLSERFNAENKDIRFSQRIDTSELKERLNSIMKEREAQGLNTGDQEADARAAAHQLYEILVEEYGAIIPGEKPYRDAKVPKQTTKRDKVSQTVRTVMEAEVTPDEVLPNIKQLIASGDFSYDVYTDEAAISDAEATITKVGWAQSLADWTESMKKGIVSKQNTAMGWALYNNAVNSGDVDTALTVLDYMVKHQRNAAQALQATRILKKLSPETQLYQAQRTVQHLQEELDERSNGRGRMRKQSEEAAKDVEGARKEAAGKIKKGFSEANVKRRGNRIEVEGNQAGEPFVFEYAQKVGEALANGLSKRNAPQQKTFLQQITAQLKRFAQEKMEKSPSRKPLTATDLLRDYIQNQDFYTEAWEAAQQELRRNHADDPALNEFINSGIGVDSTINPKNAIFMKALVKAAAESAENRGMISKQSALGFTGMSDTIADKLIRDTGASGEMAATIRDAAAAYVNDVLRASDVDQGKIVVAAIRSAMHDIGTTLSKIVDEGSSAKLSARDAIINKLIAKYGFGKAEATYVADVVGEAFDQMSRDHAAKRLEAKFKPRAERHQKSVSELLQEYGNLGAFDAGSKYNSAAATKIFKSDVTLRIDEELARKFLQAKTEEERNGILKDIYRDIGRQMPSRFIDRWNAWRYLAMLGNLRTHGRNLAGNAGFAPVVLTKNATATFIEWAVNGVSRGKLNRSKAMVGFGKNDRALLKAAWNDYAVVQEAALTGGKYDDFANANQYIEEGRKIFGNTRSKLWNATGGKALEAARKGNSKALDKEDMWFSKPHYAAALASYCKAHNLTAEQIAKGKEITNARSYAIKEAQKATYRDTNAFSQTISQMRFRNPDNNVKKGLNLISEGILPFRKTPANILARGVEYSPLGLLNGLKQAVFDVRKGKKTGAEAIDSISAGLTGTGLLALGVYLAAQGLVRGHGGDDDDKKEFEEMMGHQAYSLEMPDGTSVTLDWLAPECLPLFIGVNLWEQTEGDDELMFKDVLAAVSTVTEPLLEMSCLQSLNELFEAFGYAGSNDMSGLVTAASSAATSYITQALPTLLGQAERTGEEDRMTTYTEKNSQLPNNWQYVLGRASSRIPGWDYQQIPYIDAWGREEANGSALERGLNNFLNPSYVSEINTSSMEKELLRLYEATGEASVFPSRAPKYFNVGNKRKDLTASEYVRYATKKGKTAYNVLSSMTKSKAYKSMSNAEKVEAVSLAYEYANAVAKDSVSAYEPEGWVANALAAGAETGIKADQYVAAYVMQADIVSLRYADGRDKNKDGKADSVDNSKGLQIMKKIYTIPGLTDAQRQQLFIDFGVGKTIRHYGPALVDQKLAAMKKYAK